MKTIALTPPYLIFTGDVVDPTYAKTGFGMVEWRKDLCVGQIKLPGGEVDLGLPFMTLEGALEAGVKSLIIGTAFVGGGIPDEWLNLFEKAVLLGLNIVGGVHTQLNSVERLRTAAQKSGASLVDVRVPPADIPVGTGKKRSGKRVLMVGTDCAVGKKYTALALEKDMIKQGMDATFRASGQTGIMIAGCGIPIDAVVSDFVSGAAEILSPNNKPNHWDVVEGQGGLFHPGYGAVSFGLLTGSQPDAFIVCHEANRLVISGWEDYELPSIQMVIDRTIALGVQTNPNIRCVGVSVNTSYLKDDEREIYLDNLSSKLGLPCVDPLKGGTNKIIDRLNAEFPS